MKESRSKPFYSRLLIINILMIFYMVIRKIFRPVFPENLTRNVLFYTLWKKVDSKSNSLLEYFNQATKNHKCLQNCADFQQKIRAQNAMLKYRVNILACQNFILIHTVNCFMEVRTVVVK